MIVEEKTISSEMIYEGAILNLRKDKVTVKDGKTAYREIIEHNGAVALVPVTDSGNVVMVKQYRKACEKALLEIPAGKIDKGEEAYVCAARELREETGYTAQNIELMSEFYVACGYSGEKISVYLCTGLNPGDTDFDEDEALDIIEIPFDELYNMCMNGELEDSKTIVGILMAKEKLAKKTACEGNTL